MLSKIQERQASAAEAAEAAAAEVVEDEAEKKAAEVPTASEPPLLECRNVQVLNARDAPVVDRSRKGPIAGRNCSSLCLTLQRSATATGRDDAPAYRGLSAAADEAEEDEDEDEEDELIVLPARRRRRRTRRRSCGRS